MRALFGLVLLGGTAWWVITMSSIGSPVSAGQEAVVRPGGLAPLADDVSKLDQLVSDQQSTGVAGNGFDLLTRGIWPMKRAARPRREPRLGWRPPNGTCGYRECERRLYSDASTNKQSQCCGSRAASTWRRLDLRRVARAGRHDDWRGSRDSASRLSDSNFHGHTGSEHRSGRDISRSHRRDGPTIPTRRRGTRHPRTIYSHALLRNSWLLTLQPLMGSMMGLSLRAFTKLVGRPAVATD